MQSLVNDFITLFVAIDPLGTVPVMVPLMHHMSEAERRRVILRAALIASLVLGGFALFGHILLASMGISFGAFRIAGGIVLFVIGAKMIFEEPDHHPKEGRRESGHDIAVFPLAMPYLAGPATTLAVMVATQQEVFNVWVLAAKIGVLALVIISTVLILLGSTVIQRVLGKTGSAVIGRIMGILLAALAAESVIRGVSEAFKI